MNRRTSSLTQTESTAWLRPMVRAMFCVVVLVGMSTYLVRAQIMKGTLMGYVYDEKTKKGIPSARISVYLNDHDFKTGNTDLIITGGNTDMHGLFFNVSWLKFDSTYVFVVSAPGYRTVPIKNCPIKFSLTYLELGLQLASDTLPPIVMSGGCTNAVSEQFKVALNEREKSKPYTGCVQDNDGQVGSIRGTRAGSTDTYIDGVQITGNRNQIENSVPMPVIMYGTPAEMENRQEAPKAPQHRQ